MDGATLFPFHNVMSRSYLCCENNRIGCSSLYENENISLLTKSKGLRYRNIVNPNTKSNTHYLCCSTGTTRITKFCTNIFVDLVQTVDELVLRTEPLQEHGYISMTVMEIGIFGIDQMVRYMHNISL